MIYQYSTIGAPFSGQTIVSLNGSFGRTLFWQELGKNTLFLLQVRLASQELLVAELKNMGPTGRKHLVEVDLTTILLLIKIRRKKKTILKLDCQLIVHNVIIMLSNYLISKRTGS